MRNVLISLFIVVILIVGGLFALPFLVDINNYKPYITERIKQTTGYDVAINGDITFSILPSIAVTLKDAGVKGPQGSSLTASVNELTLSLEILPLLQKKLEFSSIALHKPHIQMDYKTVGQLAPSSDAAAVAAATLVVPSPAGTQKGNEGPAFSAHETAALANLPDFKKIHIRDGDINFITADRIFTITHIDLTTSLLPGNNNFSLEGYLTALPEDKGKFNLKGIFQLDTSHIALHDTVATVGSLKIQPDIDAKFISAVPELDVKLLMKEGDVTPYFSLFSSSSEAPSPVASPSTPPENISQASRQGTASPPWSDRPFSLDGMKRYNIHFALQLQDIVYKAFTLNKLLLNTHVDNGKLITKLKEASLLGGNASGEWSINSNLEPPVWTGNVTYTGFLLSEIARSFPLFQAIEGKIDGQHTLLSQGKSEKALIGNLSGEGNFTIKDGAIKGTNLLAVSQNVLSVLQNGPQGETHTKFSSLAGTYTIASGTITNNDLILASPLVNFSGKGQISLPAYTIRYQLIPQLSETVSSTLGKNISFPVLITGPLPHPAIVPDTQNLFQRVLSKEGLLSDKEGTSGNMKENIENIIEKPLKNLLKNF